MSSKVLSGACAAAVQPVEWRTAPHGPGQAAGTHLYASTSQDQPESGQLTGELEREIERRIEEAYRRGLQEGEAAGARAAAAQVDAVVERLGRSIEELSSLRGRLRRQAESDLIKLATAIARRILRRELSVDPEALAGIAKAALERLGTREACRVRIHPAHAPALARYLEASGAKVEIQADRTLDPGSVLFETAVGTLDAGLETQLGEIERGLTDLCRKGTP